MEIISRFIDLCLFRASPSDLPVSDRLLKISLFGYFILAVIVNKLDSTWTISFIVSLVDVWLMVAIAYLLLNYRGFKTRYTQTIIALAGTGCCLSIVGFPILWWFSSEEEVASLALLLMVVLLLWNVMVIAQIFRQSLEIKAGTATLITLAYLSILIIITGLLMSGAT